MHTRANCIPAALLGGSRRIAFDIAGYKRGTSGAFFTDPTFTWNNGTFV